MTRVDLDAEHPQNAAEVDRLLGHPEMPDSHAVLVEREHELVGARAAAPGEPLRVRSGLGGRRLGADRAWRTMSAA